MKRLLPILLLALATPLFANPTLFSKYEAVRQGLLKNSINAVHATAQDLAAAATTEKNDTVAKAADAVAKSADLDKAREAFGTLSDEMIKLRNGTAGERPVVAYCPMARKSWLQPKKDKISNPYEPGMQDCGSFKSDEK
jgi:hypothetical protein